MNSIIAKYSVVITTTDDQNIAKLIAEKLIFKKLAVCVQIEKVQSYFLWNNQCNNEEEFRLIIKSQSRNYSLIEEEIKILHNYDIPQLIELNISNGYSKYLNWIDESLRK